ncbi:MAG: DUF1059 domain-containing protein [Candidatus Hodarchaeota archaeon]
MIEISEEIPGKRIISCGEIGIISDCDFRIIGNTEEEVFDRLVEYLKEKHNTVIPPGSHLANVVRRFIRVLGQV